MASTRDFLSNLGTRLAAYPLTFVASMLVARSLGPHDRGVLAFITLFGDSLPIFGLGLGAATTYFTASGSRPLSEIVWTSTLMAWLQGALLAAVFFVLWHFAWLGESGKAVSLRHALITAVLIPIQAMALIAQRILVGLSSFRAVNRLTIARLVVYPLALVILTGPLSLGLGGAVLGWGVTQALISGTFIGLAFLPRFKRPQVSFALARDLLRYGMGAWLGDLATRVNIRVDRLVAGMFVGPTALGYYTTAASLMEIVWVVPDALSPILFNRMAKGSISDDSPAITESSHRLMMTWSTMVALAMGVAAPFVVPLAFGRDFKQASLLLQILLPGAVALVSAKVLTKYFSAGGRPLVSSMIALATTLVSGVLYFVLVPRSGAVGAAIATSVGYFLSAPLGMYLYRRMSQRPDAALLVPTLADWTSLKDRLPFKRGT